MSYDPLTKDRRVAHFRVNDVSTPRMVNIGRYGWHDPAAVLNTRVVTDRRLVILRRALEVHMRYQQNQSALETIIQAA